MKTIQNPILRGFCPDPCMIRTGDDYYIATSTFEWWPCVNLYHSKDLAHWEQLPSPLREPGQMDLRGDPNSGGIWAPDLSWDGQYYYLLVTNVTTKKGRWYNTHNYMSRAASITGPWSQPVYLNSIGFDPSLLHDTDGKCYLVNMVNGFKGVLVQQMDPETGAVLALASSPTYNAADVESLIKQADSASGSELYNRATQALYAPGSTFKMVTLSTALQTSVKTVKQRFHIQI